MQYRRGAVVKGPDLFGPSEHRPYVCLSDESHPFLSEEGLYAAVTTTRREEAIPLAEDDFATGSLPRKSFASPWTIVTMKHADVAEKEGRLEADTTDEIAEAAAGFMGVRPSKAGR